MIPSKNIKVDPEIYALFKKGSTTYFNSSLFFPMDVRIDVFRLYAFVRKADNFVDQIPQDSEGFYRFRAECERALEGYEARDIVIREFTSMAERRRFDRGWINAFLDAMETDLYKNIYEDLDELLRYIYGSAEVVGLFMAKIMDLDEASFIHARYLGRAMQYINFIRDVQEDLMLGRQYLPRNELRQHGIETLNIEEISEKRQQFSQFIRSQIDRYRVWQKFAEQGYKYIPYRYLVPIKTAADMYKLTAKIIYYNPWILFKRKVKPRKLRIVSTALLNYIAAIRYKTVIGGLFWI